MEFVDKGYGINLLKGKHYNIIPHHPLFHTQEINFNHYFFSIICPNEKNKNHS
jgi:hypothetical protein